MTQQNTNTNVTYAEARIASKNLLITQLTYIPQEKTFHSPYILFVKAAAGQSDGGGRTSSYDMAGSITMKFDINEVAGLSESLKHMALCQQGIPNYTKFSSSNDVNKSLNMNWFLEPVDEKARPRADQNMMPNQLSVKIFMNISVSGGQNGKQNISFPLNSGQALGFARSLDALIDKYYELEFARLATIEYTPRDQGQNNSYANTQNYNQQSGNNGGGFGNNQQGGQNNSGGFGNNQQGGQNNPQGGQTNSGGFGNNPQGGNPQGGQNNNGDFGQNNFGNNPQGGGFGQNNPQGGN